MLENNYHMALIKSIHKVENFLIEQDKKVLSLTDIVDSVKLSPKAVLEILYFLAREKKVEIVSTGSTTLIKIGETNESRT